MHLKIPLHCLVLMLAIAAVWPGTATANCGSHIYLDKCADCGPTGMITEDRCKAVLENIEWNLEVLKRVRCRLKDYKEWNGEANDQAREKLDELIEQVAGFVVPGAKQGDGLSTVPGQLNFAKKVADLLQMQGTLMELLVNSQGSSFFTGMIRTARTEIWHLTQEINRALAWHERNCPPIAEEEPFIEPLDPTPPAEEPEEAIKPEKKTDDVLADLPEYMRFFILWITRQGELDLSRHALTADQWEHALAWARPLGLVGFVQGLQQNLFDELLGRQHLAILNELGLNRLDVDFIDAETIWQFYHGQPPEEWMDLGEVEETRDGHIRVIEAEEHR